MKRFIGQWRSTLGGIALCGALLTLGCTKSAPTPPPPGPCDGCHAINRFGKVKCVKSGTSTRQAQGKTDKAKTISFCPETCCAKGK